MPDAAFAIALAFATGMLTVAAKRPDAYNRVAFVAFAFSTVIASSVAFFLHGYRHALDYAAGRTSGDARKLFEASSDLAKAELGQVLLAWLTALTIIVVGSIIKDALRSVKKPQ